MIKLALTGLSGERLPVFGKLYNQKASFVPPSASQALKKKRTKTAAAQPVASS